MRDITIGSLRLEVACAAGHEHRTHNIVVRAASIFGAHLGERYSNTTGVRRAVHIDTLSAPALHLDLNSIGDHEAAMHIVQAWLDAGAPHFGD
jgi:hypothetical protein